MPVVQQWSMPWGADAKYWSTQEKKPNMPPASLNQFAAPRHLGVVCSSFISTPCARGWELAFTAPVVPALRLVYLICRPNWMDGWRLNFPLYFCFQKNPFWPWVRQKEQNSFTSIFSVTVTCLQQQGHSPAPPSRGAGCGVMAP